MNSIEGQIRIRLGRDKGGTISVVNERALSATRLLHGKSTREALAIIPLLYNICGMAQAQAACLAMADADSDQTSSRALSAARELLVLAETAREHLSRIFIDWPGLFAMPVAAPALPAIGNLVQNFKQLLFPQTPVFARHAAVAPACTDAVTDEILRLDNLLETQVFGIPPRAWLAMDSVAALCEWFMHTPGVAAESLRRIDQQGWSSQGLTENAVALPDIDAVELNRRLDADDVLSFIAEPDWDGRPRETNCYTRQQSHPLIMSLTDEYGAGLLTRWTARLLELASLPAQMRILADQLLDNTPAETCSARQGGLGRVEAARGRLYHRVRLAGERIETYRILAPTEWNFHPQGLITQSLRNVHAANDDEWLAIGRLIVNAIDPCVQCRLEIGYA